LLGLLREERGVAARVLANLGVEINKVRSAVEFIIGRGGHAILGEIGLTPRAKRVIELAVDDARRMNHGYIGTEHLLLGLVREGEGIAAGVLVSLGVQVEQLRVEIARELGEAGSAIAPEEQAPDPGSAAPAPAGEPAEDAAEPLRSLLAALDAVRASKDAAISAEQYEWAAQLRDSEHKLLEMVEQLRQGGPEDDAE
jgi:ATP-dependent Clp protease ATP-binding subunit ClpA